MFDSSMFRIPSEFGVRKAAAAAFLCLSILMFSCASSRIPLEAWEKGARGTYKVSYTSGRRGGVETMVLAHDGSWKGAIYGPMRVVIFSMDLAPNLWTLGYSGKTHTFPPCAFIGEGVIENILNGDFKDIPPFFECQGWEFTWDASGGRLMGQRPDGRSMFIILSHERPVAHISVELPEDDVYLEFIQEDIYKPKPKP
jgi:hypothetical protein